MVPRQVTFERAAAMVLAVAAATCAGYAGDPFLGLAAIAVCGLLAAF